jgi:hypothetical protein
LSDRPEKTRVEGAALRGALQRIGVLRESGHEHFNGSLVIPVIAADGEVTEVYGRKLNDHLRPGTPKHLYLPGPHRGVQEKLADSVNHLLLVGFYLINIGFVCLALRYGDKPTELVGAIEFLSTKIGLVIVLLGVMHFFNMRMLMRIRESRLFGSLAPEVVTA